jgi:hypothetical protein
MGNQTVPYVAVLDWPVPLETDQACKCKFDSACFSCVHRWRALRFDTLCRLDVHCWDNCRCTDIPLIPTTICVEHCVRVCIENWVVKWNGFLALVDYNLRRLMPGSWTYASRLSRSLPEFPREPLSNRPFSKHEPPWEYNRQAWVPVRMSCEHATWDYRGLAPADPDCGHLSELV